MAKYRVSAQGARETVHISHYVVTFEGPGIAITYSRMIRK